MDMRRYLHRGMTEHIFYCKHYECWLSVADCEKRRRRIAYADEVLQHAYVPIQPDMLIPLHPYCARTCKDYPQSVASAEVAEARTRKCACGCGRVLPAHTQYAYHHLCIYRVKRLMARDTSPSNLCRKCGHPKNRAGLCPYCDD